MYKKIYFRLLAINTSFEQIFEISSNEPLQLILKDIVEQLFL